MKFSVLLSVYIKENPTYLVECMDSILNQTLLPDEIILVKDGPLTDELENVISGYLYLERLNVIPLETNIGLGKALNIGLNYCNYPIVARMDTDDIAKPSRFEKQIKVFQENPEIDVVGTWVDEFMENPEKVISVKKMPELNNDIKKYAIARNPVNHPTVMFRKSTVQAVGGYLHFPLFEDYYLWIRMLCNGAVFYNIQESLLFFRFSDDVAKRRGGWKYACTEYLLHKEFKKIGFISNSQFIWNVLTHFIPRVLPYKMRVFMYRNFLRR